MVNAQKQRKKPRGKPFASGNPHRFKPGASGNPGGLPAGTPRLSVAYRRLLSAGAGSKKLPVETVADEIAAGVIDKARQGDVRAAIEIADRTEGKAAQPISGIDNSPITLRINWVEKGLAGEGEDERA